MTPKSPETVRLGDHSFSLTTKELQDATGQTVALRSQSAEVLAHLAKHAGTLVSKEELIATVWAGTFVTDDSLVQCIGDIRRALGDEGHKIVQTIPRRGYKLVTGGAPIASPAPPATEPTRRPRWQIAAAIAAVAVIAIAAWLALATTAPVHGDDTPRIAVLPFEDFSTGEDRGYLSDAIAEGIITELARFPLFEVVARNSSFQFRDTMRDIRKIGDDLGVHYVLEGSQQKSGDKLRVTVQLIEADEGTHLWAHTYDEEIGDLFTVQDRIIKTVANRIGVRIERPVPGHDPDRVSALHLHLQAIELIRDNYNAEAIGQLIELNKRAIEADPSAPYGYIGLTHGYRAVATFSWLGIDREEAVLLGLQAADKALELAPDNPEVHYARARMLGEAGQRQESMAAYDKAIALNPSASNYLVASTTELLNVGETEEAIARLNRAMGIDPFHDDWFHWQMGWALWEIEDCEGALAAMQRMNKIRRGAHRMLAGIYACLGEVEKARAAYDVFYAEADEPTISEQRAEWQDVWTAPGSLDRWLDHMRIAGMQD